MKVPFAAAWRILCIFLLLPLTTKSQDFALLFDGLDDEAFVNVGPTFDGGGDFTFEAWIFPSSISGTQPIASWTDAVSQYAVFSIDDNGFLDLFQDGGSGGVSSKGTVAVEANEWTHVAFTLAAGSISFYVNGVEEAIGSPLMTASGLSEFRLGSSPVIGNYGGLIDEVRVWNALQDQSTIESQMFTPLSGFEGNLIAYYTFNQITGTGLPDNSTSGFDMTLFNFPSPTDPNWIPSVALTPVSPGGVNTGLVLWLRADEGTTIATGVSNWEDQSMAGNDVVQAAGTSQPALTPNGLNFRPVLTFDGGDDLSTTNTGLIGGGNYTKITVSKVTTLPGGQNILSAGGVGTHATYYNPDGEPTILHGSDQLSSIGSEVNNNIIFTSLYTTSLAVLLEQYLDGRLIGTNGGVASYTDPGPTSVGSWQGGDYMVGDIAEAIMFSAAINPTDRRKVESYLAVKYGIFRDVSPAESYLASDGLTSMWDQSGFSGFLNDVTVIGRDDVSGLHQKQSQSASADRVVTMGVGGIALDNASNSNLITSDLSFLSWANDDGSENTYNTPVTGISNVGNRIGRLWKIDKQGGDIGNLTIQFDLNGNLPPSSEAIDYKLLIDNDGVDYSDATVINADSYTSGIVEFSGVNFSDGQFFTLGIRTPSYVVTNNNDSGEGSLRQTILDANNSSEETISFNMPGSLTISVLSQLPTITSGARIDGTTQSGWTFGDPANMVIIDGASAPGSTDGIVISSPNVQILGMVIDNFDDGIRINGGSDDVTIGSAGKGNVIKGSARNGIAFSSTSDFVSIQANRIGTSIDGTSGDGNLTHGISVTGNNVTIGGNRLAGEGNLISANGNSTSDYAIQISNSTTVNVYGNLIGTNAAGTGGLGNNRGINITTNASQVNIGGTGTGQGNVISDNGTFGVVVQSNASNVVIDSNIIGLDNTGNVSLGNNGAGVSIISADGPGMEIRNNVISANTSEGIEVDGVQSELQIINNLIGTNASGEDGTGHGNLSHGIGIRLSDGLGSGQPIVIDGNTVSGNGISTNINGINFALANSHFQIINNRIGVESVANTSYANAGEGIEFSTTTTDVIVGGSGNTNVISYNGVNGILFAGNSSNGNDILLNVITCNTGEEIAFGSTPLVDAPVITTISASSIAGTSTATNSPTVHLYEIDPTCVDNASVLVATRPVTGGNWSYFNTIDVTKTYVATVTDATNGISEYSAPAKLATAPANLVAYTSSATEITFEWTDSPDETSYILERADDFGFTSGVTTVDGAIPAGTTSTTFSAGVDQAYFYRLTAVNALGSSPAGIEFATTRDFPGYALHFNGTNQQLTVTSPTDLPTGNDAFTIEAWVKPDNQKLDDGIVSWGNSSFNAQFNGFMLTAGETYAFGLKHTFRNNVLELQTPDLSGEWHHVAVSYDGTTRTLYLDGVPLGSDMPGAQNVQYSAIFIASSLANFDGQMDEVKIWNIAKTDFSDRFAPLQGNESGLIAYYPLDENTGTNTVDRSTNSNQAAINFGPGSVPSTLLNKLVTNTNDSGAGSLRQAITEANGTTFQVTIEFDLPSANDIINVTSGPLPVLDGNIIIDATTQTGWVFSTGMIPTIRDNCACDIGLETAIGADVEIYGLRIADFDNHGIQSPVSSGSLTVGAFGKGNVIVNNGNNGVNRWSATDFTIQSNHIGVEYNGVGNGNAGRGLEIESGGSGAIIGGLVAGEGNVISSNTSHGIFFNSSDNNEILGNYVGTDHLGTAARPNGQDGLFAGSNSEGHRIVGNIFSGNTEEGLYFLTGSDNITIRSNKIGVDINGDPMGNGNNGIYFDGNASDNKIGGLVSQSNDIGNNGGFGILYDGTTVARNFYSVNSFHDNTSGAISHTVGSNSGILPPVITSATTGDVFGTGVSGHRIHVYVSDGNGQGETLLDSADVDGGGNWTIGGLSISLTDELVATATHLTNGSSEFSTPFLEQEIFTVTNTANSGVGTLREVIGLANASLANTVNINFNLSGDGSGTTWTTQPNSALPIITRPMIIDGETQTGWNINTDRLVVLDGNLLAGGSGIAATINGVEIYGLKITGFPVNGINFSGSGSGGAIGDENRGNVINDNGNVGIYTSGISDIIIRGNRIGTNYSGTTNVPNAIGITLNTGSHSTIIGGSLAGQGNLISGNTIGGVSGGLSDNLHFEGNIIGLNISHGAEIPNGSAGISITPTNGSTIVDNIISGNTGRGIELGGSNQIIIGNTIGTDLTGTADFGNGQQGIRVISGDYDDWQIGTGNPGEGNVIAFNGGNAIQLANADQTGHLISQNSIYNNGGGIELSGFANTNLSAPNITNVTPTSVSVDGIANLDLVEVFIGDGNGQGQTFIGSAISGGSTLTIGSLSETIRSGDEIVVTRIQNSTNNTSEFSSPLIYSNPNALDFDGLDDEVTVPHNAILNPTDGAPFSIEAWVKPRTLTEQMSVVHKGNSVGIDIGRDNWFFTVRGDIEGQVNFIIGKDAGGDHLRTTVGLKENTWHHIAMTTSSFGGPASGYTMYIDGVDVTAVITDFDPAQLTNTDPLRIGTTHASGSPFDGEIDEVRIWTTERTQGELLSTMFTQLNGDETGLLAYYDFNEGVAGGSNGGVTTLPDYSVNGLDGTLNNFDLSGSTSNWVSSNALQPFSVCDLFTTEVSQSQIDLSWTDRALNESGYTVERSIGNNTSWVVLDNTLGMNANSYSDNSVTSDNGYFYRVIANGATGDSDPSNEKFGSTITEPGNALRFDGADDYVEVAENVIPITGDFTVELWAKKNPLAPNGLRYDMISQVWEGGFGDNFWIGLDLDDQIRISTDWQSTGIFYPDDGLWHHIAVVKSSTDLELYIDGVFQAALGSTINYTQTAAPEFRIGRHWQGFVDFWSGEIDEVRIWSEARTQPQIAGNMFQTMVGNELNLDAYYRFDQDEGTDLTIPDRSRNNFDGTWFDAGGGTTTPQWPASGAFNPAAPSGLFAAEVSDTQIDLNWTDLAENETGYTVERSDGNNTSWVTLDNTLAPDATSYSDNSVTPGNGYFYRIIANGAAGDSDPSNEKFASTLTPPGNSLQFDGTDDYMEFDDIASTMVGSESAMTIEFWVNPSIEHLPDATNSGSLFSINGSGGTNTFLLYLGWTGAMSNQLGFTDDGNAGEIFGPVLDTDRWYHVAYVRSGSIGTLYVDGNLYDTHTSNFSLAFDDNWSLGQEFDAPSTTSNFFNGSLDEVRVWTTARTEPQIQGNMFNSLVGNEGGLVAYYKFDQDEPTDLIIPDRSANNFDGAWNGGSAGILTPQWTPSTSFSPTTPINLFTTEVSTTQIDLNWTDLAINETGYTVERSDGDNLSWVVLDNTLGANANSYSDNSVTAGNGYFYRVIANGTIDSEPSNEKFASTLTPPGNGLQFDGTDDFVDITSINPVFAGNETSLTFELWMTSGLVSGTNDMLIAINGPTGNDNQILISINDNEQISLNDNVNFPSAELEGPVIADNTWHHVAYTRDGSLGTLYVDGMVVGTHTANFPINAGDRWSLGQEYDGASSFGNFFTGQMDEVRIWNVVRSQPEIQANLDNSLTGNEPGLIAYYKFDQGGPTNLVLPDRSTNNYDGIWNGASSGTTTPSWQPSGAFSPVPPSDLFALETSTTQIDLTWSDNSSNETDFLIERSDNNKASWTQIGTSPADDPTFSDNTVTAGNRYYYRVRATNIHGNSGYSNEKFASTIDPPGNGLAFDGTNDYVDLGNPEELRIIGDMTIEAWVNWEGVNGTTNTIISRSFNTGENADQDIFYRFGIGTGGELVDFFEVNGDNYSLTSTGTVETGVWTHVVMVRNATDLTQEFYINGEFAGRSTLTETPTDGSHPGQQVWIGNRFGASIYFDGVIDEVRIWDVVRTPSEIQTDFASANVLVGNEPGLAGYFRFDQEGNFSELPDRSQNNSNGVLTNFPADPSPNWVTSLAMLGAGLQPNNLFAEEISTGQIDLSWDDPASAEDGFLIERSDGNNTSYSQIGSVGPNVLSYSDNTVSANQGYFYRIIATSPSTNSIPSKEKFGSTITSPGNALEFDGIDDNLIVYNPDDLGGAPGQSFTWEAWLRVPPDLSGGSGSYRFFLSRVQLGPSDPRTDMSVEKSSGLLRATIVAPGASASQPLMGVTDLRDFQWHHVAWVRDTAADEIRLYVDGTLEALETDNDVDGSNNGDLYIGDWGRDPQDGRNFYENMDEVRFWNVARTQAEIRSSLASPLVGNETGLVAYYKFDQDETTDMILPDRSRNFNNGIWNGPVAGVTIPIWVGSGALDESVLFNNALDFGGSGEEVDLGNPDFSGLTELTVEAWIRPSYVPEGPGNETSTIIGKGSTSGTGTTTFALVLEGNDMGGQLFGLVDNGSDTEVARFDFGAGFDIQADEWRHAAMTWSAGNPVRLFVDGVEVATTSNLAGTLNVVANNMFLGTSADVNEINYEGVLDEVRIWSVERSQSEIQTDMFNELIGNEPGLFAYYSFNQGIPGGNNSAIDFLSDASGNGVNGSLQNFTLSGPTSNWIASTALDGSLAPEIRVYLGNGTGGQELFHNQIIPVNFGDVPAGSTQNVFFTVENDGLADLFISGLNVGGEFNVPFFSPLTLSPGDDTAFDIELDASTPGISNDFLIIETDDADESSFTIPITGTRGDLTPKIWWTDDTGGLEDDISRSNLDGTNTQAPYYSGFTVDIRGIALDQVNNMIFWTNTDAEIYCGRIGESGFVATGGPIIDESGGSAKEFTGIAVDGTAGKIYWADAANNQIRRANFDGTGAEVLHNITSPEDIEIDVDAGKIYYIANNGFPEIWRSNLDGSGQENIYSSGTTVFRSLALDLINSHVYWTENNVIGRMDLDGSNDIILSNQVVDPGDIEVDRISEMIYVVERDNNSIVRLSYNDDPLEVVQIGADLDDPRFLALDTRGSIIGGVIRSDYSALEELYNATDGGNWTDNTNWLSGNVNTWFGVTTIGNRITEINLGNNNLSGTLPTEIGDLSGLVTLDLDFNSLTGNIPSEISGMIALEDFDLNNNQLSGSIPTEIENLTNLTRIDFNNNQLSGSIPIELGSLVNLQTLIINNNDLTGSLPVELGNLVAVENFDFHNNQLTGSIPTAIGNLTLATKIHLQGNQLTGEVPIEITNLSVLADLGLHTNQLSDLPDLSSLTGLTSLRLESNSFQFDDLEANAGITGVVYSPQANVAAPADENLNEGDALDVTVTVGGSANQYQWYKDGSPVVGQTTDNLQIATVTPSDAGSYHLEVTNTTAVGLTISSDPFTVIVNGNPTVVTQDITVSLDVAGNLSITPAQVDNGSSDDVTAQADLIFGLDLSDFDCTTIGANTVTLTVTDEAGNSANATATVTVIDDTDPTAIAQDLTVSLDAAGNVSIVAASINNGSTDNCGINSLSLDITDFDCTMLGANTVTLTVTDDSGNSANATATVTVVDDIDPVVITQDVMVTLDATNQATITTADIDNGSSDNCPFTLSLDVTTFGTTEIGDNTVTLTATDGSGNTANATATVTVLASNQAPTISYIFYLDENSPDGTMIGAVLATDPEGDLLTYSILSGNINDAFALGSFTGELTVNSSTALDFEVTPVFNLMVEANDGNGGFSIVDITINLNDIIDENPLGFNDLEEKISVYPNPASERLFVELKGILSSDLKVQLFTVGGSQVLTSSRILTLTNELIELDLDELTAGIYLLKISDDEEVITKNVLVK